MPHLSSRGWLLLMPGAHLEAAVRNISITALGTAISMARQSSYLAVAQVEATLGHNHAENQSLTASQAGIAKMLRQAHLTGNVSALRHRCR